MNGQFRQVSVQTYDDVSVQSLSYDVAGPVANYSRDALGRLESMTVDGASVVSNVQYGAPADVASRLEIGTSTPAVVREDVYDIRRNLVSRKYTRSGTMLAEVRYAYDGADQEVAQQHLHQAGRTNFYGYDTDSRLVDAELFVQLSASQTPPSRNLSLDSQWAGTRWREGDYGRGYVYGSPDDRLVSTSVRQQPNTQVPIVAQSMSGPSPMGHPTGTDGFSRTFDALGNVTHLHGLAGDIDLWYDGLSRLRRVQTPTLFIDYTYRADGALGSRKVSCVVPNTCTPSERTYIYDGLLLLEVYESSSTFSGTVARYYYADEGDIPIAADFDRKDGNGLQRYFLMVDRMGSVIGVLDRSGEWVERVRYDPWGQRVFQPRDAQPPAISEIRREGNDLYVIFTEPVQPRVSVQATGIIETLQNFGGGHLSGVVNIQDTSGAVVPSTSTQEDLPGYPQGSVIKLHNMTLPSPADYSVVFTAGTLVDDWNNGIAGTTTAVRWDSPGTLYSGSALGSTRPAEIASSLVGNEVGFQAHLHDSDAGLILMRARVFDPTTGMFLQPDPEGHLDSVNQYAGMAWNSVDLRDPTGENSGTHRAPRGRRGGATRNSSVNRDLVCTELQSIRREVPESIWREAFPPELSAEGTTPLRTLRRRLEHAREVLARHKFSQLTRAEQDALADFAMGQLLPAPPRNPGEEWRNRPGTAFGHGVQLSPDRRWIRQDRIAHVPEEVAHQLRGRHFRNFGLFQTAFWKEVYNIPRLRNQFKPQNQDEMKRGNAPFVRGPQSNGRGHSGKRYNLHHKVEVADGGPVYDASNILVASPFHHHVGVHAKQPSGGGIRNTRSRCFELPGPRRLAIPADVEAQRPASMIRQGD